MDEAGKEVRGISALPLNLTSDLWSLVEESEERRSASGGSPREASQVEEVRYIMLATKDSNLIMHALI